LSERIGERLDLSRFGLVDSFFLSCVRNPALKKFMGINLWNKKIKHRIKKRNRKSFGLSWFELNKIGLFAALFAVVLLPFAVADGNVSNTVVPTVVPSAVPTSVAKTCGELAASQSYYFSLCKNEGFDNVCFNKYSAEYQGCTKNSDSVDYCIVNNVNGDKNILCPISFNQFFGSESSQSSESCVQDVFASCSNGLKYLKADCVNGVLVDVKYSVNPCAVISPSAKSFQVLWPNGEETLQAGKTYSIEWTAYGIPKDVLIEVSYSGVSTSLTPIAVVPNTGSYNWAIPETMPPGKYHVCLTYYAGYTDTGGFQDCSNFDFEIISPTSTKKYGDGTYVLKIDGRGGERATSSNGLFFDFIKLDYNNVVCVRAPCPQFTATFLVGHGCLLESYPCNSKEFELTEGENKEVEVDGWRALLSFNRVVDASTKKIEVTVNSMLFKARFELTIPVYPGWNMFSIPIASEQLMNAEQTLAFGGYSITTTCKDGPIYAFDSIEKKYEKLEGFVSGRASVFPRVGYWFKNTGEECSITVKGGYKTNLENLVLQAGWNFIGSPFEPVAFDEIKGDCVLTSGPWFYNAKERKYEKTQLLSPGKAYFVKVAGSCTLRESSDIPPLPE